MFVGDNSTNLTHMKALFVGMLVVMCLHSAKAQLIRVPVGQDTTILRINNTKAYMQSISCNNGVDGCLYTFFRFARTNEPSSTPAYIRPPFFALDSNLTPIDSSLHFLSFIEGSYIDTISSIWISIDRSSYHCVGTCEISKQTPKIYSLISYFDSTVKLKHWQRNGLVFVFDSVEQRYVAPRDTMSVMLFNNFADSIIFDDWTVSIDPKSILSINIDHDPMSSSFVAVGGRDHKSVVLSFASDAIPFDDTAVIKGHFTVRAHNTKVDTTISFDQTFIFYPQYSKSVFNDRFREADLRILPNPSKGITVIKYITQKNKNVSLSIFDELGREVRRVHDGFLDAGEHEFSAELPAGMYYVRMQAGGEVLTRKVTVVR